MAELPVGTTLRDGHYTVGPVLGVSDLGVTYEGRDNLLNRRVALKELYPTGNQRAGKEVVTPPGMSAATWEKAIASFVREATTLGHLDHPSIVSVYDHFNENNTAYMVMKFISGITLDKYVAMSGGRLAAPEAIAYTVQVGQALEVLHAANILHRDIKPSNIMRASNGQLVLIDFGSAREFAANQTVMQTAFTTRGFTPPEQFVAFGRKGPYTDIYSLAATCYYLLTGALSGDHLDDRAASPQVIATLRHALADSPQARPQTVAQFLAELQGRAPVPVAVAPPRPVAAPPSPPPTPAAPQAAPPPAAPVHQPARPATPPFGQPSLPQSVDATTAVPEYLIRQNPASPPQPQVSRTVVLSDAATVPPPPFYPLNQNPLPGAYHPPNQPPPPNVPPSPPYATLPLSQPAGRGNRTLLIIPLIILLALAAVAAFLLLNKGATNATIGSLGVATATVAVAPSPITSSVLATATTVSLPPSPTLLALTDAASPTLSQPSDTPLPVPTDTPLPAPSDTPLSTPSDTPLPLASATPLVLADTPIVAPPVRQPLPPTRTPRPRPTRTPLPHPTATTRPHPPPSPLPPTPMPPVNQPPPNPTTTAAGQLGNAWVLLGPPNFNSYCAAQAAGATAKLTKASGATALDWACFSPQGQKVGGVDMAAACHEQYPGFNFDARNENLKDPNGWACYRGNTRVAPVQENAYCQRHYPNTVAAAENGVWFCFQPKNIGPINVNAACANQYGAGALGYWGALVAPNSWNCYRRK